jgi:mannosyltransferase OCH1-like enzyme
VNAVLYSSQSDALRLAVAHVYGGWYSDIDTVFMKPLTDLDGKNGKNLLSTDGKLRFNPGRAFQPSSRK